MILKDPRKDPHPCGRLPYSQQFATKSKSSSPSQQSKAIMEPPNSNQTPTPAPAPAPAPEPVETKIQDFYCSMCNVKNNNLGNYNSHIISKKHVKKLKRIQKTTDDHPSNPPKLPVEESRIISNFDVGEDDLDDMKFCKVCTKHFPSEENAKAHYKSKGHLHKLSIAEKTWNPECAPCKKKFSSEQQWKQHVGSVKHMKLTQIESTGGGKKAENVYSDELEATIAEKVHLESNCDLCAKRFCGKKPIDDHLKSKEHKKNLKMAQKLKSDLDELEKQKRDVVANGENEESSLFACESRKRVLDDEDEDKDEDVNENPSKKLATE
uniref:C2H2-type domain-containing protein n=1 Tax=Strigamia maritima TaxID=126957 RepID=T1J881_STRMM